ncbi:MAG: acyl carrier protein, partial [Firmicutes bacterium]|nr:acyl carrier protein [Bacillota bacterium]
KKMLANDIDVNPDAELYSELGITSMQTAQLAYMLEEFYDIEIPDTVFKSNMTPRDFANIIDKCLKEC